MKRRYAVWLNCIISNYADHVMASSVAEARWLYAQQRGCSLRDVEVMAA